jgi:hypothetical protein
VNADPQVLLPIRHLEELVAEEQIGELTSNVISFVITLSAKADSFSGHALPIGTRFVLKARSEP